MNYSIAFILLAITCFEITSQKCVKNSFNSVICEDINTEDFLTTFFGTYLLDENTDGDEIYRTSEIRMGHLINIVIKKSNFSILQHLESPEYVSNGLYINNLSIVDSGVQNISDDALKTFSHLQYLDLSNNNIRNMSFVSGLPSSIIELYLRNNDIQILDTMFVMPNLQILDLSFCKITQIEFDVFRHTNIYNLILNLSHNILNFVSMADDRVPFEIDFSYNKIRHITSTGSVLDIAKANFSNAFVHLNNLVFEKVIFRSLNLTNNYLPNLNEQIFDIKSIIAFHEPTTFVDLSHCSISSISDTYFESAYIHSVNLSNNNIQEIPSRAFLDSIIENLIISNTNLKTLATSFHRLDCKNLILRNNKITEISSNSWGNMSSIATIDLSYNPISKIENFSFYSPYFETLFSLNVSHAKIKLIEVNSFKLDNLNILDISYNLLKTLDKRTFSRLPRLQEIYLQKNKITSLGNKMFANFADLQIINLSENKILKLSSEAFLNLNVLQKLSLELDKNHFIEKNAFSNIKYIKFLQLKNIGKIDSNYFNSVYFHDLNLSENISALSFNTYGTLSTYLSNLNVKFNGELKSGAFINLFSLDVLHFENSEINVINNDSFKGLYNLKNLSFTNSVVHKIESNALRHLYKLKYLDSQNLFKNIKRVDKFIFRDMYSLPFLNLSSIINYLAPYCFSGLKNLKILNLDNNNFSQIDSGVFEGLSELKVLNLSKTNLTQIDTGFFDPLERLEILYLNSSGINNLGTESFRNISNLKMLFLQNNNMSEISIGTFRHFQNLIQLDLSFNNINKIKIGAFSNLPNLKQLNLSHNKLSKILIDVFFSLKSLEILNLESNHLKHLEVHIIQYLPYLSVLGIADNKWKCEELSDMLAYFQNKSVNYSPTSVDLNFKTENVDGISCIDICNFVLCTEHIRDYHGPR